MIRLADAAARVRRADPRLKVLIALILGLLTWSAPLWATAGYGLLLLILLRGLGGAKPVGGSGVRMYAWFVGFWMAVKCLAGLWEGLAWPTALGVSLDLGVRLFVLLTLGLALAASTSPRRLGLALSWALRPVLRNQAWKAALALALMIHFLPLAWQTLAQVKVALRLRGNGLTRRRRTMILTQAVLRVLCQKTWRQTVAVAARGLDRPDAWPTRF